MTASSLDSCPGINTDPVQTAISFEHAVDHGGSDHSLTTTTTITATSRCCRTEVQGSQCHFLLFTF